MVSRGEGVDVGARDTAKARGRALHSRVRSIACTSSSPMRSVSTFTADWQPAHVSAVANVNRRRKGSIMG